MITFQRLILFLSCLFLSVACQSNAATSVAPREDKIAKKTITSAVKPPRTSEKHMKKVSMDNSETSPEIRQQTQYMYLALTAELYNRLDVPKASAENYQQLVSQVNDAAAAKRATILAATHEQSDKALLNAQKWVQLQINDLEANQYLVLLFLRNNKVHASAMQLRRIEQIVRESETVAEGNSFKSLRFIGALLSVESHHLEALNVFKEYLKQSSLLKVPDDQGLQVQQQLILASLANQAGSYDEVISSLKQLDSYVRQEEIEPKSFVKASLMKAKALKKVQRISDAVEILKPVVDYYDASDSVTLELVRLLIMDEQKHTAFSYLKALTEKHPQNKDLLKSLIALEIDQSDYASATKNIQKLRQSADYKSDAEYFMAEIFEAQGDIKSALEKYQNVTTGSLMKNAEKKVARLSRQLTQENKAQTVNFKKKIKIKDL